MTEAVDRMKGKRVVKPIVYGNTATAFGYKRDLDQHTHHWTVFLKSYHDEDPSTYIRKVQFKLHDSYANSTRVVEKPPYEVSETGWGEFEVQIRIFFTDVNEKPVTAFHYLRLFQPLITMPNGSTIVVSEYYDEIIFQEPTVFIYKSLNNVNTKKCDPKRFKNDLIAQRRHTRELMESAREEIVREIEDLRESLRDAHRLLIKHNQEGEDSAASTPRASVAIE